MAAPPRKWFTILLICDLYHWLSASLALIHTLWLFLQKSILLSFHLLLFDKLKISFMLH
jgi:hypothetical protein